MKAKKKKPVKNNSIINHNEPSVSDVVLFLTLNCASMEMTKDEYVEFAPLKGCCGPFRMSGNSLPVFTYTVFEKKIMEFISVRVEISKPNNIMFSSRIDSTTAPERHGEVVETLEKYKEPFNQLSRHLVRYFPFYPRSRSDVDKNYISHRKKADAKKVIIYTKEDMFKPEDEWTQTLRADAENS